MVHFRQVSHHQIPDLFTGDDKVLRVDLTSGITPSLHDTSFPFDEARVPTTRDAARPPDMSNVERMAGRAKPIQPIVESVQTGVVNSLLGLGAGALGSLEQEVHKLRRLCSRAGGVAALRFRALDAALAAQGVCQHG